MLNSEIRQGLLWKDLHVGGMTGVNELLDAILESFTLEDEISDWLSLKYAKYVGQSGKTEPHRLDPTKKISEQKKMRVGREKALGTIGVTIHDLSLEML